MSYNVANPDFWWKFHTYILTVHYFPFRYLPTSSILKIWLIIIITGSWSVVTYLIESWYYFFVNKLNDLIIMMNFPLYRPW